MAIISYKDTSRRSARQDQLIHHLRVVWSAQLLFLALFEPIFSLWFLYGVLSVFMIKWMWLCYKHQCCSLDEELPKTFLMSVQLILLLLTGIVVPAVTNPWLLCVFLPLTALVVFISRYYLNTCRELKRLESICCSPVFSHISETLEGLETIRTRGKERDFLDRFYRYLTAL